MKELKPGKIICVGLNYKSHAEETGGEAPSEPVLFSKFGDSITWDGEEVILPPWHRCYDYEAELVAVIGKTLWNGTLEEARAAIRGYPGVLAFFTAVNQPHVHAASIGVDAEFPRIEKLQFFPAASAAMIHADRSLLPVFPSWKPVCFFSLLLIHRPAGSAGRFSVRLKVAHTFLQNLFGNRLSL